MRGNTISSSYPKCVREYAKASFKQPNASAKSWAACARLKCSSKVGVESEEGKGSRFWFELKGGQEKQSRSGPAGVEGTADEGAVLYVEDEERDAIFMVRPFAEKGLSGKLQVVGDGRAAIDYLSGSGKCGDRRKHPTPTLVLLDLICRRCRG